MNIRFSARANREFKQAADYLLEHDPISARRFADTLEATIAVLSKYPEIGRPTSDPSARVFTMPRFPYRIFYDAIGGDLVILSIFHTSRKPDKLGK